MAEDSMIRIRFNGALLVLTRAEVIRALRRGKQMRRAEKTQEREAKSAGEWPEVWPHDC